MSLLLEALKKAELAKQGAQSARTEPTIAPEPMITRDNLPEFGQPIDLLSTGFSEQTRPTGALQENPGSTDFAEGDASGFGERQTASAPDLNPGLGGSSAPDLGGIPEPLQTTPEQKAAKQMFEAKEVDYNPRRPFYITIGVLVLCGAGYGGYVWWQMQPRSIYNAAAVKSQPARTPEQAGSASDASTPPTAEPVNQTPADGTPPAPVAVPAPNPAPAAATRAAPGATNAPQQSAATAKGQESRSQNQRPATSPLTTGATPPAAPRRAPAANPSDGPSITIAQQVPSVDPMIEQAYAAFQKSDFGNARELYQAALKRDASSRDALLGLAAIDMRSRDFSLAEARYLRLLENDPRDADALAGLISLRGQVDPTQSESRLKTLIAAQPEASQLHFALGNVLASQRRWNEAQASYFKAYSLEPESPDFAFNLAVSLDQMRQVKPALEYYRRAVALAGTRSAGFDKAVALSRIAELSRP